MRARPPFARSTAMPLDPTVEKAMLAAVPDLHGFAIALCRRADRADDLVQEALLHAIDKIESFTPGTNMSAWLSTILRNNFCNEFRKRRREVSDSGEYLAGTMAAQPEQESRIRFAEFRGALAKLPDDQRAALLLVGASGLSYDEAAEICRCPVGTIKSRTNRGRVRLAELMSIDTADDLGPDRTVQAALTGGNLHWAT
jgi:RNA polymerase sigma-70 factor (ECF subfamily)